MRVNMGRRLIWLGVICWLLMGALGGRVYHLQVIKNEEYSRRAHFQRTLALPVASARGQILDRHGQPLTDPQPGYGVAAFQPLVKDPEGEARTLAALLAQPEEEVRQRLTATTAKTAWLAQGVSDELYEKIRQLRLPGIVAAPITVRYGPGSLARHLVGYVNESNQATGLEARYLRELSGDAVPSIVAYLDAHGTPLHGLDMRATLPTAGKQPYNLHTTIDLPIQKAVEEVLNRYLAPGCGTWRGAAVVIEPHSGEVLAMASRPDYDQATDARRSDPCKLSFLTNRAISNFEPGSVFKAVVAAAALEGGHVSLDERFYCPGHYTLGGQTFRDAGGVAHGWLTFREALAKSCNIVFAKVGYERLGAKQLREAAERFGFGSATGIGLDGDSHSHGALPDLEYGGDVVQMSFGQGGIMTTPLQIGRAFAAIANGGTLPALKLVTAIKNPAGRVMDVPAAGKSVRVISAATAKELQQALVAVTDPRGVGTGRRAWIEGVGVAGKTGSAEGSDRDGAAVHAWFAGYLPAAAPQYVIVVMQEGGGAGGEAAAPIFREIGKAIVQLKPGY